jgi:hypothetical protein
MRPSSERHRSAVGDVLGSIFSGEAMANELILIVEDNAKNRKLMRHALQFTDIRLSRSRR